jgi:hypothetical protein
MIDVQEHLSIRLTDTEAQRRTTVQKVSGKNPTGGAFFVLIRFALPVR